MANLNLLVVGVMKDSQKAQMVLTNSLSEIVSVQKEWLSYSFHEHSSDSTHLFIPLENISF